MIQVAARTGLPCVVASIMPEGVEPAVQQYLIEHGVAPLMGMSECLDALGTVAGYQFERCSVASGSCVKLLLQSAQLDDVVMQNEFESKKMLAKYGLKTPRRWVGAIADAPRAAAKIGFAVALLIGRGVSEVEIQLIARRIPKCSFGHACGCGFRRRQHGCVGRT